MKPVCLIVDLRVLYFSVFFILLLSAGNKLQSQSLSGTTGLFQIPTAEVPDDKTIILGFNQLPKEYTDYGNHMYDSITGFGTVVFLPRLELMFRYTYQLGREDRGTAEVFMDRMVSVRFQLIKEGRNQPSLLFGLHDTGGSVDLAENTHFSATYIAATKHVEIAFLQYGLHAGYAFDLPGFPAQIHRGLFGGLSVAHLHAKNLQILLEYDSFYWNAAVRYLLANRLQILAGFRNFDVFSGGISYRVTL